MRFRRLQTDSELQAYADGFAESVARRSGGAVESSVSIEYLRRCRVKGVFDKRGNMIGGYSIGTSLPLRLLDFVPEEERASLRPPRGASWEDCCEVVCMWRSKALSSSKMTRVWSRAFIDTVTSGKRIVLGHNENPSLDKMYNQMGAETLYQGLSAKGHPSRLLAHRRHELFFRLMRFLALEAPGRAWTQLGKGKKGASRGR